MSFSRGTYTTSTPVQPPPSRGLYPSLNVQTPVTPTPSNPPSQQQAPLQQKPPPRPASVPLSFGGGLSHSASAPTLSQAFQNAPSQQQPFSPAPQPPLTTFDLSGNSSFAAQQGLQWGGGQLGGHGLTRSHSQQFIPQPLGGAAANPLGERRYLPSHLRPYSPERSSPLAKEQVIRKEPVPSPKEKRRVSFGSVTTFGHPSTANFGGAGFGTPKYVSPSFKKGCFNVVGTTENQSRGETKMIYPHRHQSMTSNVHPPSPRQNKTPLPVPRLHRPTLFPPCLDPPPSLHLNASIPPLS